MVMIYDSRGAQEGKSPGAGSMVSIAGCLVAGAIPMASGAVLPALFDLKKMEVRE